MILQLFIFLLLDGYLALNNGLYLRPPMGWMSWARFRCIVDCETYPKDCISENLFREMADHLLADGWKDAGYEYVNIDDCWQHKHRDSRTGRLIPDRKRFPHGIRALADYVHSKGLKLGIYSDIGVKTCQHYPGSLDHFHLDAATFAEWQVDSLKFDGCFADPKQYDTHYPLMGQALNATGRPIAYICSWPAYQIGSANFTRIRTFCNSWRNYKDIQNTFQSVNQILDWFAAQQDELQPVAGPGGWNDPDMLIAGNNCLTVGQTKIQMTTWAILAAPLMLGNDIRTISPQLKAILQNKHVIRVNQDHLGHQGRRIRIKGPVEIWTRALEHREMALAVVHRSNREPFVPHKVSIYLKDIGWGEDCANVQDLYSSKQVRKRIELEFEVEIEYQNAAMFRLYRSNCVSKDLISHIDQCDDIL